MRIVKVKTSRGRVLYGILKNSFLYNTFYSLYGHRTWSDDRRILEYCLHDDLERVQKRYTELSTPPESVLRIIERKKCQCNCK